MEIPLSNESKHEKFEYLMNRWCIPRLAGTEGSYKIVELLKEDFKLFDLAIEEQKFPVFKSDTTFNIGKKLLIIDFIFSIFLVVFWFQIYWSSLVLLILILLTYYLLRTNKKDEEILQEKRNNQDILFQQSNLILRKKPLKENKRNIILMAHHDSKSQTFPTEFRVYFALIVSSLFLLMFFLYLFCVILEIIGITEHLWLQPVTLALGWIAALTLLLLSINRISNQSPGALDNASGLYTLWKTAEKLQNYKFDNCEIWFILTGCEEIGQIGSYEFLKMCQKNNKLSTKNTFLLNYEMIALKNHPLSVLEYYSFPKKKNASPLLFPIVSEVALNLGIEIKGWYLPIGAHTDGLLFRKHGYSTLDFVSKEAGRYTHLKKDRFDLIDPLKIDELADLNIGIIKKLDQLKI